MDSPFTPQEIRSPFTPEELLAKGKALRAVLPREEQGLWAPAPDRLDVVDLLLDYNRQRRPDLLPLKWVRMRATPFAFYRGSTCLLAHDIGRQPTTGLAVQMCGDAHLANLGAYSAPAGHLVFDLNDFDDTAEGPWEWDLKRLAVSAFLAGRDAGNGEDACRQAVLGMVRAYRRGLARFSSMLPYELARFEINATNGGKVLATTLDRAQRNTPLQLLDKVTVPNGKGWRRFISRPPGYNRLSQEEGERVLSGWPAYRASLGLAKQGFLDHYTPQDVILKVVGVNSVGTNCYVVLCFGHGTRDPLFLQLKAEAGSCWAPYLPESGTRLHEGFRVARGQKRGQTSTDPYLGWTRFGEEDFLVRQWSAHKASFELADLTGKTLLRYSELCGQVLAKLHARTGQPLELSGYCGGGVALDKAICRFSEAYANQVRADYGRFCAALDQGLFGAVTSSAPR